MAVLHAPNEKDEHFAETAWSVVIAAGAATPARAHAAMAELCSIYWRPIYAYLRRSGYDTHDAEDLTQSFFQHLLENETLRRASRERGRFRNFLLGALKLCLADEQARRHTLKRGGGAQFISTDELEAEELHHLRAKKEFFRIPVLGRAMKLRQTKFSMRAGPACSSIARSAKCARNFPAKEERTPSRRSRLSLRVRNQRSPIAMWRRRPVSR